MVSNRSICVLNPRLAPAGLDLEQALQAENFQVFSCPLFSIENTPVAMQVSNINYVEYRLIFTSQYAVQSWLANIDTHAYETAIALPVFAIGQATAKALAQSGFNQVICPAEANSENFILLPELSQYQKFVLFKGQGGRNLIEQALQVQGKTTQVWDIYKRVWLPLTPIQLTQISQLDAWLITSGEMLEHLLKMLHKQQIDIQSNMKIFVPSQRVANLAATFSLTNVINTQSALNSILVKQLKLAFSQ
jgi:uroporphyrinogen-III synthase